MKLAQTVTKAECGSTKGRSNRFTQPDKSVIEALVTGCNGDVRSLLNSLQFACLKGAHHITIVYTYIKLLRYNISLLR